MFEAQRVKTGRTHRFLAALMMLNVGSEAIDDIALMDGNKDFSARKEALDIQRQANETMIEDKNKGPLMASVVALFESSVSDNGDVVDVPAPTIENGTFAVAETPLNAKGTSRVDFGCNVI